LPPTWTAEELGKRGSLERFFGRVFSLFGLFRLQRPPLAGWSAVARCVALTAAATIVVGLAAQQAGWPDLLRSPKRLRAHPWRGRLACGMPVSPPFLPPPGVRTPGGGRREAHRDPGAARQQ